MAICTLHFNYYGNKVGKLWTPEFYSFHAIYILTLCMCATLPKTTTILVFYQTWTIYNKCQTSSFTLLTAFKLILLLVAPTCNPKLGMYVPEGQILGVFLSILHWKNFVLSDIPLHFSTLYHTLLSL